MPIPAQRRRPAPTQTAAPSRKATRKATALSQLETHASVWIASERPSGARLASMLGISLSTVNRVIASLRRKGVPVRTVRESDGWHYEIHDARPPEALMEDPILQLAGVVRGASAGASVDEIVYRSGPKKGRNARR